MLVFAFAVLLLLAFFLRINLLTLTYGLPHGHSKIGSVRRKPLLPRLISNNESFFKKIPVSDNIWMGLSVGEQ